MLTEEEKLFLKDRRYVLSVQKAALLFGIALSAIYIAQLLIIGAVYLYSHIAKILPETITGSQVFLWVIIVCNQIVFISVSLLYTKLNGVKVKTSFRIYKNMSCLKLLILITLTFACIYCLGTINYAFEKAVSKIVSCASLNLLSVNSPLINTPSRIITAYIVMGVLAPICEEALFRGALLSGLCGRGKMFGVLVSSFMFAFMHGNIYQLFYQFILGMVLATVTLASNTLIAPIIVHSLNNIIALTFDICAYNPYSTIPVSVLYFVAGIIIVPLILCVYIYVCKKESEGLFEVKRGERNNDGGKRAVKKVEEIYLKDCEILRTDKKGVVEQESDSGYIEDKDDGTQTERDDGSVSAENIYDEINSENGISEKGGNENRLKTKFKILKQKISATLDKLYFKYYIPDNCLIENYKEFLEKVKAVCQDKEVEEKIKNESEKIEEKKNFDSEKEAERERKKFFNLSFSKKRVTEKTKYNSSKIYTYKGKEFCFENLAYISEDEIKDIILKDLKKFEKITDDIGFKNFVTAFENKISNVILTSGFAIIILVINTIITFM